MKLTENMIRRIVRKVIAEAADSGVDDGKLHKIADYCQKAANDEYRKERKKSFDNNEKIDNSSDFAKEDPEEFRSAAKYLKSELDEILKMWADEAYDRALEAGASKSQANKAKSLVYNKENLKQML